MVQFVGDVMVLPWIRGREPSSDSFLQLVACQIISVFLENKGKFEIERTFQLVDVARHLM
jgi:hypothetical protein